MHTIGVYHGCDLHIAIGIGTVLGTVKFQSNVSGSKTDNSSIALSNLFNQILSVPEQRFGCRAQGGAEERG